VICDVLNQKCSFKGTAIPTMAGLADFKEQLEADWSAMLAHQLPSLAPVDAFWNELSALFAWIEEGREPDIPEAVPFAQGEVVIRPPAGKLSVPGMASGAPLEVIRFAASNRLRVELDYLDERGRRSVRIIEPYSLRRTQSGDIVLHAIRADNQAHRSYRIDRIRGARATEQTFVARYAVELTPAGPISVPAGTYGQRTSGPRTSSRSVRYGRSGPTYVYECGLCGKRFEHSKSDSSLRPHNDENGWPCSGRYGIWVDTSSHAGPTQCPR
jgi:hypothetical protein